MRRTWQASPDRHNPASSFHSEPSGRSEKRGVSTKGEQSERKREMHQIIIKNKPTTPHPPSYLFGFFIIAGGSLGLAKVEVELVVIVEVTLRGFLVTRVLRILVV